MVLIKTWTCKACVCSQTPRVSVITTSVIN